MLFKRLTIFSIILVVLFLIFDDGSEIKEIKVRSINIAVVHLNSSEFMLYNRESEDEEENATRNNFLNSGRINHFLSAFSTVTLREKSQKTIILSCFLSKGNCGGIADRVRGILWAVSLALISGRRLIIHNSILSSGEVFQCTSPYGCEFIYHVDNCNLEHVEDILTSISYDLYLTTNCGLIPDSGVFRGASYMKPEVMDILNTLANECNSRPYYCGAAVMHFSESFRDPIKKARSLSNYMLQILPKNYICLHIRAGGSKLRIENRLTSAVSWEDGFDSKVPGFWLDVFARLNTGFCDSSLAVISDSDRFISELRFILNDRLPVFRCCFQPIHRDRSLRKENYPLQELIDLFIMSKSASLVSNAGGFSVLGRIWSGLETLEFIRVTKYQDILKQAQNMIRQMNCSN
jgi:hypothetical protein